MALQIRKVLVTSCFLWLLWREQVEMGGLSVKDKSFWSIKYPKQSKLPSKNLGSLSLNSKTEAVKDLWTPSTWMGLVVFASSVQHFVGICTLMYFFFFLGRGSTAITILGSCLKITVFGKLIIFSFVWISRRTLWSEKGELTYVLSSLPSILQAAYETWMAALRIKH